MKTVLPGLNIQYPISRLILERKKSIETRTYPLPKHYIDVDMLFIETPGLANEFKARAVGVIRFAHSFKYSNSKDFYADVSRHLVVPRSKWAWKAGKPKWGWVIKSLKVFKNPIVIYQKRGIKFSKALELDF